MPQITDLNVAPYYDDFDEDDNFHRVLFRPGFSIQARELTTLQSILQAQVEKHGRHMFREGTVIIPGQASYSDKVETVQLASTFGGETLVLSQYLNTTTPVIITGATSGLKARVIGIQEATSTTQPILILQYINTGSDNETAFFADGENISANVAITHTTSYTAETVSATTFGTDASQVGSAVKVEEGVYFIRGQFVKCQEQTLILSTNSTTENARVGFTVTETLQTPETDASLTDNATGSNNYAAKGAHRLKIDLTLSKLDIDSTADTNFIELLTIKQGSTQANNTELTDYSVLGDTLARRTFDESGDYTVRPFQFDARESIDNTVKLLDFDGVFTKGADTNDGATAAEDLLAIACTPGKAYVRGYEIEKTGITFKDLKKARDFETTNAGVVNLELGNFVRITNVFGTPDISSISGETTPYKEIKLFDEIGTRGSSTGNGNQIGVARARAIEHFQGTIGSTEAVHKLFLFDIQMFTKIDLSDTPSPLLTATHSTGVRLQGQDSGATGFVHSTETSRDGDSGARVNLVNTSGEFNNGEKIIASDSAESGGLIENSSNADLTITTTNIKPDPQFLFGDVKSLVMIDPDSGQHFTADVDLQTISTTDQMRNTGADDNDFILLENGSETVGLEFQREPRLREPEKNIAVFRMPKSVIKTLLTTDNDGTSDSQITVRKQFVGTTNSSGAVSFSAGTNETFVSFAARDYSVSILTAGGGTGSQGDLVDITSTISGTGSSTVTITDNTILGASAKVKFTGTVLRTSVSARIKTTNLMKQVKVVASDADGAFGTRASDKTISLGRADAYRLVGVFDSEDTSADATLPSMTVTSTSGTFIRGERITGGTSGAKARLSNAASPLSYVLQGGFGATDFSSGETITGEESGATATVGTLTAGSKVITGNFELDTGQRDTYYDIARIVRKAGATAPLGRLAIIFDYFSHGSGDFFSVDSYSASAGQMNYDDIPTYSATRVDPDDPEPTGVFDLRDCLDFRPTVENIAGTSETVSAVDTITGNSFDFTAREFDGTGAVVVNTPKPNSASTHDFEFYLPKMASLFLDVVGNFIITEGNSSESPEPPKDLDNAMKLASLFLPAFTFKPTDVQIRRFKTQRFTMKDIGGLKERLENVESMTALSLLERDAESFEIQDSNTGLNRFKSGFVVDNFGGHRVGDTLHRDYQCSIDMRNNHLRPKCVMRNAALTEVATTTTARTGSNYQKTGDLLTLPYTSEEFIKQPYATRVENVQTYLIHEWVGKITLDPAGDEWFETEEVPANIEPREGNFDSILQQKKNEGVLGTVWNAWQDQWSGIVKTTYGNTFVDYTTERGFGRGGKVADTKQRVIQTTRTDMTRTGLHTSVVERIDEESLGKRVIARALIPFVRPRILTVTGNCFRPGIRLYAFFDGRNMSNFVTPSSTEFTTDATPAEGSPLITNGAGTVEFTFRIPETRFAGQSGVPKFRTGELEFRLTSSSTNNRATLPLSAGQVTYKAVGILETEQEQIIATRNADVIYETVNDQTYRESDSTFNRVVGSTITKQEEEERVPRTVVRISQSVAAQREAQGFKRTNHNEFTANLCAGGKTDPLAQTFLVTTRGGTFITKIDLFFSQKDDTLPVWVEIRNVVNGYPGGKLLPFGRAIKQAADVNVDATTASSATTFTFDSPVYLQEGQEYCFVTMTNSLEYKLWITQMGEPDVSGSNRIISAQPHGGSLFKSQNNRTWNAVQSQDKKFTMYSALFDTATNGTISLTNDNISEELRNEEGQTVYGQRLLSNPIVMTSGSTVLKVKHRDHGMYSTSNNVTITGVSSEIETTLSGAITTSSTSLTLASSTNFPSSGTVTLRIKTSLTTALGFRGPPVSSEIVSGTISGTTVSSLTRGVGDSDATAFSDGDIVELYQINGVPLTEINATHTAIANIGVDSYTINLSTTNNLSSGDAEVGGINVFASENYRFEVMQTALSTMELSGTSIVGKVRTTSATSPSGTETSFSTVTSAKAPTIPLGENITFDSSRMVASKINETNELSSAKSFFLDLVMSTNNPNISPVVDLGRASVNLIANRVNSIDSSSDVYPTTDYNASTEPDGDQNVAIYLTKAVALENPATSIRVVFAAMKKNNADIEVLFKTLGAGKTTSFDELGYRFFNTDGSPDSTVATSLSQFDFQEYQFSAGLTDDGIGTPLDEFTQFQIKIVMKATNAAEVPLIKDLRVIALS